ncbi:MAG: DCC1-like thiol-disulfide oxidoreductase family protein [Acidobacteriaceae bacterium]
MVNNNNVPGIVFYIDGNCRFCRWGSHIFRRAVGLKGAAIRFSSSDPEMHQLMRQKNSWILRTASGDIHFGFDAITYAVSRSPRRWLRWLTPFMRLRPIQFIGQAFYELITASRPLLSKLVPATA